MKNFICYLALCCFMVSLWSCEEKEDEVISRNGKSKVSLSTTPEFSLSSDSAGLSSRAAGDYPIVSFTGETNVKVGQAYTYKVLFRQSMSLTTFYISSSNGNAILISKGDTFSKESSKIVYNGQTELTFFVLVVGAANNVSLSISCDKIIDNYVVSSKLEGINATYPTIEIKAPTTVLPLEEFYASVKYEVAPNSTFSAEWSSDFQKLSELYDKPTSTLSLKLKSYPTTTLGTHKLSLNLRGKYEPNKQFLIGQASCEIRVANPFKIKYIPSSTGCNKIFEMQDLKLVSGAKITWTTGDGLRLVSGQNTGRAEFIPVEGYQGNTKVQATIIYNNTTYNETSEEVWIGLPKIVDENQYEITWRNDAVDIRPSISGAESINWKVISGNITYSTYSNGISIKTSIPQDQSGTATVELNVANSCGISVKRFEIKIRELPTIYPDQWTIAFPKINGDLLQYYIIYKPTKDYFFTSLYITYLYNGAYDGEYASQRWEWVYDNRNNRYIPPLIKEDFGSTKEIYDAAYNDLTSSGYFLKGGVQFAALNSQRIKPGTKLENIEYTIFYIYDLYETNKRRRFTDVYDFIY